MNWFRLMAVSVLGLVGTVGVGLAQDAEESPSFEEQLDEWLPGMGAEKIPDRRDSQQKLQDLMFQLGAPGREKELSDACAVLADKLATDIPDPAKIWLLKQLEFSGGAECVDAVAAIMDDAGPEVKEAARRALQNNPSDEAKARLLAALAKARDTKWKLALCNALGDRGDEKSVDAIVKLLSDKDEALAAAAANALGNIANDKAAQALAAAEEEASGTFQIRLGDAYLRCADQVLASGDKAQALKMYDRLAKPDRAKVIRMAAMQGKLNAAGR